MDEESGIRIGHPLDILVGVVLNPLTRASSTSEYAEPEN